MSSFGRGGQWEEFDLEARVWTIPAEKMKMRKPHHVPLSRQSVALVEEICEITKPWSYIFPSLWSRKRPMSDNTLNAALRRMGYTSSEMTAHGFRAMASTLLNESGKWSYDAIERALAHGDNNRVRAAYHQERVRKPGGAYVTNSPTKPAPNRLRLVAFDGVTV